MATKSPVSRSAQIIFSTFLRIFFQLLYNQFARLYDLVAAIVSVGRWQTWVLAVLPYLNGPAILEIGHGPGHLQKALFQKGLNPAALDASREMGVITRKNLLRANQSPRLVNGYAQSLPFPAASFDQVVATFPSEYIYSPATLSEIFRVLKPEGELLITPAAWIRSSKVIDRLMRYVFKVTGQAPDWNEQFEKPFREARFIPHTQIEELASSAVLIIRAHKQPDP